MSERALAIGQGVYFAAAGAAIGATLVSAGARRKITGEIAGLAVGSALGLAAIDVSYSSRGRISPIDLADAALEGAIAVASGTSIG